MRTAFVGLLALAGCGEVKSNHLADAPGGTDGRAPGSDGSTGIDAAPTHGTVTVHVLDPKGTGADAVGVQVVFVDSTGPQAVATNGSGVASADVKSGASVTSIAAVTGGFQLQTVTAVEPGDHILISSGIVTTLADFTLSVPNGTGAFVEAFGPCGASESVATSPTGVNTVINSIPIAANCDTSPGQFEIASFDANFNVLGFLVKTGVAFTPGGTGSVTGAYAATVPLAASFTNLPAAATNVQFARRAPDINGFSANQSGTPDGGSLDLTVQGPALPSTAVADTTVTTPSGQNTIREVIPGNVVSYAFDASTKLIPFVGKPTFDIPSATATIASDPTNTSGVAPDLFRFEAQYIRSVTTGGVATNTQFTWNVYGPVVANLTLPAIPVSAGDVMPQAGDRIGILLAETMNSDAILHGYADTRLDPVGTLQKILVVGPSPGETLARFSLSQVREGLE